LDAKPATADGVVGFEPFKKLEVWSMITPRTPKKSEIQCYCFSADQSLTWRHPGAGQNPRKPHNWFSQEAHPTRADSHLLWFFVRHVHIFTGPPDAGYLLTTLP
jgi:hypothetical protein